ncbi:DNA polymerase zeta catalytic subunit [Populus alba x Populus x berolinensis]|uniref:DNA-directed DNA polymerase n=1 Tax=Populus alba x Populus x berolinensis TaxID=444605 RepID=A0AAD6LVL1_9ROSI|nr:DNA polymerase zeta catalytic subunit [Populus alba x Populus x berolinensis]
MFLRLAHTQNYIAISPGNQQVASQPEMECLPLVMEPESGFYADPVVVLDFQSLYPSMIIAYNLCFCTCLGNVAPSKANTLGVSSFSTDPCVLRDLKDKILFTPNGTMYVPSENSKRCSARLLEEILSTRIMLKQAMKKLAPSQQVLHRGYTAAGFSGRMPCAVVLTVLFSVAESTLEKAISLVSANEKWKAKVIIWDALSKKSFQIGREIASAVTAINPDPVTLKLEKVYHPCFLLTKKRYVGYSYESADQIEPMFDAKGIETVRRDTCGAVAKIMEQSLRLFFEHEDISEVKTYLQRQWTRILSGRVSLQDFVFAKEVRLEPCYAERVPYVVIHGEPGARLVDMVVDPLDLLAIDSPFRLNDVYYITKQIIPALQRVFGLLGADLNQWFSEMPREARESFAKRPSYAPNPQRTRIDYYYLSKHWCSCVVSLGPKHQHIYGNKCSQREIAAATAVIGRTSKIGVGDAISLALTKRFSLQNENLEKSGLSAEGVTSVDLEESDLIELQEDGSGVGYDCDGDGDGVALILMITKLYSLLVLIWAKTGLISSGDKKVVLLFNKDFEDSMSTLMKGMRIMFFTKHDYRLDRVFKLKIVVVPKNRSSDVLDIEMKKWGLAVSQYCDFMNLPRMQYAYNVIAKRPKRQLLPGNGNAQE